MLDLSAEVSTVDLREINRSLSRVQRETGKSASASVVWASRRVAQAGAALSKPGQIRRRIFSEPTGVRGQKRVFAKVYSQKKSEPTKIVFGTGKRIADFRQRADVQAAIKIKRRGLARNVWRAMQARIGGGAGFKNGQTAAKNARVRKRLGRKDPEILLNNRLTYLHDAYPGIQQAALNAGAKALAQQLDRRLRKATGFKS